MSNLDQNQLDHVKYLIMLKHDINAWQCPVIVLQPYDALRRFNFSIRDLSTTSLQVSESTEP